MNAYEKLKSGETKLAVVGLGYVGMPIAVSFARQIKVIGFDYNKEKVENYKQGIDPTKEVGDEAVKNTTVEFTASPESLRGAGFIIVAVPTPLNSDHTPDLAPVIGACQFIGRNLAKGTIVVFESTVYPGVTEEVCVPLIEKESGLKCGAEWKIGYSPERINPGDKVHRLENIKKIVSGMDADTLEMIAKVYELVVDAGVHRAESIKVAEAAKVIENSQRDINIAFMNELAMIFHKMGIDTKAVLEAARTKWNFLDFRPGLVGGHCIGIDPYYLTYRAEQFGYHSQIILAGRRINDDMGKYIAESLVKLLIRSDVSVKGAKVAILGFTFKENCPDTRNTRVVDIYNELKDYGIISTIVDPQADGKEMEQLYGIKPQSVDLVMDMDAVIIAVKHKEFEGYTPNDFVKFYKKTCKTKVLMDIKGIYDERDYMGSEWNYWRL